MKIKMKKLMMIAVLSLGMVNYSQAASKYEVGVGFQYGGVIGAKYTYLDAKNSYYASLGFLGAAVGYQRILGDNSQHAVGISTGVLAFHAEHGFTAATYNYYEAGVEKNGWQVGLALGARKTFRVANPRADSIYADSGKHTQVLIMVSLGYRF